MSDLQDQVAATKRAHILSAAAGVFAERGFHAATVRDVARAAGVADGTIYNHFENKGALLLGLFDQMAAGVRAQVPASPPSGSRRDTLAATLALPLNGLGPQGMALFRAVLSEVMVNRELGEKFAAQVLAPMLAGGVLGTRDRVAPRLVLALVLGLLVQRALGDEVLEADWDGLPARLADLLLDGLPGAG